jgi:pimeloyl-ACP methyl ester carboxylesterase
VSRRAHLAKVLARVHRMMPGVAGRVHTSLFINTRRLGNFPDDLCPLGARRLTVDGVPRVATVYVWGSDEPTVLALHGWGSDSTTMSAVADATLAGGGSAICFDAPGHGVSPGTRATITEYAHATSEVLQRFPSIHTIVAHSLGSIAAVAAVAECEKTSVRDLLLLAPACSLSHVLERWAMQNNLPRAVVLRIYRELDRRDGVPVSHWDIRTLGLPAAVRVRILHDPTDTSVPLNDSHLIAKAIPAEIQEVATGTGHDGLIGSAEMRAALSACLQCEAGSSQQESSIRKGTRCR